MLPEPIFWNVHMYGVMVAIGVLVAFLILTFYNKWIGVDDRFNDFVFYNGIVAVMLGFGFAAVFQGFYNWLEDPSAGFALDGGITFLGGLLGGAGCFMLGYVLFGRKGKGRLMDIISVVPCAITVGHALGRVGCFFAGCCYGKPTESFLGVKFPYLPVKVHPTQLYEAFFLLALFLVMSYLLLKKRFRYNFSVYLIAYGVFRFFVEFLRDDERGSLFGALTPSQFWSLVLIVGGVVSIFALRVFLARRDAMLQAEEQQAEDE